MIDSFKEHIKEAFFELEQSKILIASSGGIDSMVLTDLCLRIGLNISIAHCNFNLRVGDSDKDQTFVETYANDNGLQFYSTSFDTNSYKKEKGLSTQVAARELRYQWFETLIEEREYDYVLTAHHKDDSIESFFINLSRGSGIDGLCGIPAKRGAYRRPLLIYTRAEIKEYAIAQKIEWREDSSNQNTRYLRNQIRHHFIDEFSKLHPTAKENLSMTMAYLQDSSELIKAYREQLKSKLFQQSEDKVIAVDIKQLLQVKPLKASVYSLFAEYGFSDSAVIIDLAHSTSGKNLYSKSHQLLKARELLLLKELNKTQEKDEYLIEDLSSIDEPIKLQFNFCNELGSFSNSSIYVDYNKLEFPLKLRKKQEGDFFYPFGMKGVKKLSKFFKDEKYDQFAKEDQWLLCDASNQLVWVVGKRFDHRYSVGNMTTKILKITLIA